MKAAVLHGVRDLRIEEVPDPRPGANDVLVRVRLCGLCGSEFRKWDGRRNTVFPFIPGHEWSGDVIEVGSEVQGVEVGDRVVGESGIHCGRCSVCRDGYGTPYCPHSEWYGLTGEGSPGALAPYIAVRAECLHQLPDHVSHEEGALVEPLSVSYYAIWGVGGGVAPHDRVVVFGAGPIGLLALLTATAASAPVFVVEPSPYRRDLAERLGADGVIDPLAEDPVERIMDYTGQLGATLIVECSSNERAVASTVHVAARGGRIVLVGMKDGPDVPMKLIETQFRKVQIIGSAGAPFFFPKVLAFVSRQAVDLTGVITHRIPLSGVVEAFALGAQAADTGKILIDCGQTD